MIKGGNNKLNHNKFTYLICETDQKSSEIKIPTGDWRNSNNLQKFKIQ